MALDLLQMYKELDTAIKALDEKLDSRDGGSTLLRSKIINDNIASTEANWTNVSNNIIGQLASAPEDVQIGFYFGLVRSLDKAYGDVAKKFVDAKVEAAPKLEPLIREDEVPAITEQRKEVYTKIKAVINMAETFGDDSFTEMENPRRRGGAPKGKRGPRAITYFTWTIDDKEYKTLKDVLEDLPVYDKVSELTKAIRATGVNLTVPPAKIEFTLPNGKVLVGINNAVDDGDDDDETDETPDEESAEDTVSA